MSDEIREELALRISQIESLASPPVSLDRILSIAGDPDAGAEELASAIQMDPAITARVLKLANSAYFGFSRKVESVDAAVVVVGFRNVRNLAACAVVAPMFEGAGGGVGLAGLWRHSCAVAEAARLVAVDRNEDDGPAYVSGLLHDLGQSVLATALGERYSNVIEKREVGARLLTAERKELGVDHAWAGGEMIERWQLSSRIVRSIRFHHKPHPEGGAEAAQIAIAEYLAERCDFGDPNDPNECSPPAPETLRILQLQSGDVERLFETLQDRRDAIDLLYRESLGGPS